MLISSKIGNMDNPFSTTSSADNDDNSDFITTTSSQVDIHRNFGAIQTPARCKVVPDPERPKRGNSSPRPLEGRDATPRFEERERES